MKIIGVEGLSEQALDMELARGARLVRYEYAFSVVVMSFKRSSEVYFIKAGSSRFVPGLSFTAMSLLFGWWGFPWGPIYTIGALATNCGGGKDVTDEILKQG